MASVYDDVLRVYLDSGLSAVTTTTGATPDTISAYVVLENPTLSGAQTDRRKIMLIK